MKFKIILVSLLLLNSKIKFAQPNIAQAPQIPVNQDRDKRRQELKKSNICNCLCKSCDYLCACLTLCLIHQSICLNIRQANELADKENFIDPVKLVDRYYSNCMEKARFWADNEFFNLLAQYEGDFASVEPERPRLRKSYENDVKECKKNREFLENTIKQFSKEKQD